MNEEELTIKPYTYSEYATEGLVHFMYRGTFVVDGITYSHFASNGVSRNMFDFLPDGS